MTPFQKKLTALDSLFASFSDPYGTSKHLLLERGRPPYLLTTLISVLMVLLAPIIAYQSATGFQPADPNLSSAVVFTATTAALLFLTSSVLILKALRIKASVRQAIASCLYSTCPSIPLTIGLYILSYTIDGEWSVVQYLATGANSLNTVSLELLPFAWILWGLLAFRVYLNCMQVLSGGSYLTCFFITAVAAATLYGSYLIALGCVDSIYPGYSEQTASFFSSLSGPTK